MGNLWQRWRDRRFQAELSRYAAAREAERAGRRTPLDQLSPLVRELIMIGRSDDFLTEPHRQRTVEIGRRLHERGGHRAMLAAHQQVADWLPHQGRHLEYAWDGIGDWRG
jgi:hypothetical protein